MKKNFILLMSIISFLPTRCMDDPILPQTTSTKKKNLADDKKKNPVQKPTQIDDTKLIKQLESDALNAGDDIIQIIEDRVEKKPIPIQPFVSDASKVGHDVIQIVEDKLKPTPNPASNPVPNINLTGVPSAAGSPTGLSKQPKTPISNVRDLGKQMTTVQNTQRTARATDTTRIIGSDPSSTITRGKKSVLPNILVKNLTGQTPNANKKLYTEDEVRDLLKAVSPALHEFSEKYSIGLDQLEEFAILLHEFDISPQVLTEYIHLGSDEPTQNILSKGLAYVFGDPHQQNLDSQLAQYEKIKQENPEHYKTLVLELLRKINDGQTKGGQATPSPLTSTHTALQNQTITDQKTKIRGLMIATITFLCVNFPAWATSITQLAGVPLTNGTHH